VATGLAGGVEIQSQEDARYQQVLDVLARIMNRLAQLIVRDGEGATKFITVRLMVEKILKNVVMLPIALLSRR